MFEAVTVTDSELNGRQVWRGDSTCSDPMPLQKKAGERDHKAVTGTCTRSPFLGLFQQSMRPFKECLVLRGRNRSLLTLIATVRDWLPLLQRPNTCRRRVLGGRAAVILHFHGR